MAMATTLYDANFTTSYIAKMVATFAIKQFGRIN